jgi:hypothetical protein
LSRELVVNNQTFDYPTDNQDPGWGQDASDWAAEVTDVLNTILAPGDILQTTFDINDNQSSPTSVQGLAFDSSVSRSANITYSIYRTSTDTPAGNAESGVISIVYDNNASVGTKWKISQTKNGEAGVLFTISDLGQFSYTSTEIDTGSGGYAGTLKFSAKSTAI